MSTGVPSAQRRPELIEVAGLLQEYVHNDIIVVKHDPFLALVALDSLRLYAFSPSWYSTSSASAFTCVVLDADAITK